MLKGRVRTVLSLGVLVCLTLAMTGCWDRKEIENRGFVLGVAIDHVTTPEPKGQYDLPHVTQEFGERKYRVTFELPRFRKGEEKGTSGTESHYIFNGEGESMFQIVRSVSAKTYFSFFFEDTQVLIFSEEVAKEGIREILDYFLRNPGMRRKVKVFVTPGRAEEILNGKLTVEEVNSIFIARITQNADAIPRFAVISTLGDAAEAIQGNHSFVISKIVMENGDVKLTSAALLDTQGKMVGSLDEREVAGGKIIRQKLKGGAFSIPNPANPEKLAVFEVVEGKFSVNSHIDGDRLWFTVEAELAGNLGENTETGQKALDPDFLAAVEKNMAAEFTAMALDAYYKQQALKADALDLGSLVHRQYPKYWEIVKDRWDEEVFPTVPMEVHIKM
ncbi:MAG: gerAC [Firmicutes bacterium]|nr:gerAC [Bacillota bacterium]